MSSPVKARRLARRCEGPVRGSAIRRVSLLQGRIAGIGGATVRRVEDADVVRRAPGRVAGIDRGAGRPLPPDPFPAVKARSGPEGA